MKAPDKHPFYQAPADIASYSAGQIVASRAVTPMIGPLPVPITSWQISYRSNDQVGEPILAVTTLIGPAVAGTDTGKRPIVSYQVAEDSVGTTCAPSYNIVNGTLNNLSTTGLTNVTYLAPYLLAGWALAIPDHEGPQAYFGIGLEAGAITLDGIRAVKSFTEDDSIGPDSPVGMSGYSGGAHVTAWAAQMQPTYSPELKLAGAAIGGVPADYAAVARNIDGGPFAGFEFGVFDSLVRAYPSAGISALLNARGHQDLQTIKGMCQDKMLSTFAFRKLSEATTVPDPLSAPAIANAFRRTQLCLNGAPQIPIYNYHANTDEVVPVGQDNDMVTRWRAKGTKVREVRDPIGEHAKEYDARLPSVLEFLRDRFDGKPFSGN